MRIAVVGPTYPFRGGIAHYTTLMVENLRSRHELLFISYRKQYPRLLYPGRTQIDDSSAGIRTENEPLLSITNPATWRDAVRRIMGFRPDIIIYSWVSPVMAPQFRYLSGRLKRGLEGVTNVFLCHNIAQHERRAVDVTLTRYAFKNADRFIVHGERSRRSLEDLIPGARVTVADHPTYDVFASSSASREKSRGELGFGARCPVILYFGFVRSYKGVIHLLRATRIALERIPDLQLMVVGEFWEGRESYDEEIARCGIGDSVTIVDRYVPNEEVATYFTAADLVVLPYVSASASGIIQISYGFNKPVVTTDVGDLSAVVEEGRTGYLVPPADPDALAKAIISFFTSGRAEDFSCNIENYRSRFSWDRLTERIESIP